MSEHKTPQKSEGLTSETSPKTSHQSRGTLPARATAPAKRVGKVTVRVSAITPPAAPGASSARQRRPLGARACHGTTRLTAAERDFLMECLVQNFKLGKHLARTDKIRFCNK